RSELGSSAAEKDVMIRLDVSTGLVLATDEDKLTRLLRALLDNAVRHTPQGHVVVTARPASGGATLEIRDSGPGIAPELIVETEDVIAGRTGMRPPRQLGFGLRLAGRLVRALGASLTLVGSPGGTTCHLVIPDLAAADAPHVAYGGRASAAARGPRVAPPACRRSRSSTVDPAGPMREMGDMGVTNNASSFAASLVRLGRGAFSRVTEGRPAEPAQVLELYDFEGCPYCRKVREVLTELDLDYRAHPVAHGSPRREELVRLGGKMQAPYLVDKNTNTRLYESDDIIAYLNERYGGTRRAGWWLPVPSLLDNVNSAIASALRLGRGSRCRTESPREGPKPLM